jgi:hypothetical protein
MFTLIVRVGGLTMIGSTMEAAMTPALMSSALASE